MLLALAAAALGSCAPVPGLASVLARPELQFLMLGEVHGTAEMPALVGEVLCQALQTQPRRPLVLAVELPAAEQDSLDRYMRSDGGPAARARLLSAPGWSEPDARRSDAIVALIEATRRLGRNGRIRLVAFDARPQPGTSPEREDAMAAALIAAAARDPRTLVIAHTGSGHADREGFVSRPPAFASAMGRLPARSSLSIVFARIGGRYLDCRTPAGETIPVCVDREMPARERAQPFGIVLDPGLRSGFEGLFYPAAPWSASGPATPAAQAATSSATASSGRGPGAASAG